MYTEYVYNQQIGGSVRHKDKRGVWLKGEYVFDDHIFLCTQYDKYVYRPIKTKDQTNIPLPPEIIADLKKLVKVNVNGFLFSEDGGVTPMGHHRTIKVFHRALKNIGHDKR